MFNNNNAEKLYNRLNKINEDKIKEKFLDSIRFQDNDIARKANAILNFSGILIAGSLINIDIIRDSSNYLSIIYSSGLIFLLIGISFSLYILIKTEKKYSSNEVDALEEYYEYIEKKQNKLIFMYIFSSIGGIFIIIGFFYYVFLY